ncbi:MAG: sigma-70 family RNA polymerase sigma factor [Planctomycetes bacterium]|nr:sigma-70 family RNA polymerase sigma factor [Planctomycetota bacterium]
MTREIRELVESASHGDTPAVNELLERFIPGLHAFVRLRSGRMLLAKESSSDLVQSICREVLQDVGSFKYESEAHFKNWLYTTALRKIANRYEYYRAQKRDVAKEVAFEAQTGGDSWSAGARQDALLFKAYHSFCTPSRQVAMQEELKRIEGAFDQLTDEYREVILLARIVGLPHSEIAKQMNRTEGAVRTLLFRALTKLSGILDRKDA